MLERELRIINPLGLHARAAAKLVKRSAASECTVSVVFNGRSANGRSILGVLGLAAPFGSAVTINVDGPDEEKTMQDIAVLFLSGFGEI
jgi:phosphocarrier protein